jgi:hypothetical protein
MMRLNIQGAAEGRPLSRTRCREWLVTAGDVLGATVSTQAGSGRCPPSAVRPAREGTSVPTTKVVPYLSEDDPLDRGLLKKREGHGCGTTLQVRGSFASGPRLLFITTNVIDSVELHPRKDESCLSFGSAFWFLLSKTRPVFISLPSILSVE